MRSRKSEEECSDIYKVVKIFWVCGKKGQEYE